MMEGENVKALQQLSKTTNQGIAYSAILHRSL
jgi:hypothetical protein